VKTFSENFTRLRPKFERAVADFAKIGKLKFQFDDGFEWISNIFYVNFTGIEYIDMKAKKALDFLDSFKLPNPLEPIKVNEHNFGKFNNYDGESYQFSDNLVLSLSDPFYAKDYLRCLKPVSARNMTVKKVRIMSEKGQKIQLPKCRRLEVVITE